MSEPDPAPLRTTDSTNIEQRAVRGGAITFLAQAIKSVSDATGTLLLARMLTPADFGMVDMVVAITGIIDLLKDFGLSTATIQKREIDHSQVSALFWINVLMGVVLTLATIAAAPFIGLAYGRPDLVQLTLALSASTLLGALAVQHNALLRRDLKFTSLGIIDVTCSVISVGLALVAAYRGLGPWALVVRQLVRLALQAVLSFALCDFRPSRPKRANIGELLRFGTHLSGFQLMNYIERNLDNVLIGRFAGAQALGFYTKAYEIMRIPMNQLSGPVSWVVVPALSRLAPHPERYVEAYLRVTRLLLVLLVPLAPLSVLCAEWLIPTVLGPQWVGCVPIFQWLGLTLVLKPLASSTGWLFVTQARTREMLNWSVLACGLAIVAFVIGLPWGALGVAISYTLMDALVRCPILFWWVGRSGPVSTRQVLSCIVPGGAVACVMGLAYVALHPLLDGLQGGTRVLVASVVSFALGYAVLMAIPLGRRTVLDGYVMLRALRNPLG